jgi:hypothetical protein
MRHHAYKIMWWFVCMIADEDIFGIIEVKLQFVDV